MGVGGCVAGGAVVRSGAQWCLRAACACVRLRACADVRIYVTLRFSCVMFLRYAWYVLTSRVYIY